MKAAEIAEAFCEGRHDDLFVEVLNGYAEVSYARLRVVFPGATDEDIRRGVHLACAVLTADVAYNKYLRRGAIRP